MLLTDFFAPWTLKTILGTLWFFICFDGLGFVFRRRAIGYLNSETRAIDWALGYALFSFVWFVVGFFFVPSDRNVIVSLLILTALGFFYSRKQNRFCSLIKSFLVAWPIFLIFFPFLGAVIVKTSLPPFYSDEMAYHFVSPAFLSNLKTWTFFNFESWGGVFHYIPKVVDIFFLVSFSLLKTNVASRAFNFLFLYSAFWFLFLFFKNRNSSWVAVFLAFAFLSIPQNIVHDATVGFVDIPAISLRLLGLVTLLWAVYETNKKLLFLSAALFGISLGIKYASLTSFVVLLLLAGAFAILFRRDFLKSITAKDLLKAVGLFSVFGFYWYIKNVIVTGNPIFPFMLPCFRFADKCGVGSEFFGDWTLKVNWQNLPKIYEALFYGENYFRALFVLSLVILIFAKSFKQWVLFLTVFLAVALELFIFSKTSGFYGRYHQHIQLFILLGVSLQFSSFSYLKNPILKFFLYGALLFSFIKLYPNYENHINYTNGISVLPQERSYFKRQSSIYDFVEFRFPGKSGFVRWCEENKALIQRYDPDLTWYDDAAYIHQYMVNCFFDGQKIAIPYSKEKVRQYVNSLTEPVFIMSANECLAENKVVKKYPYEDEPSLELRKINNELVCCAHSVGSLVYEIRPKDLKCR